ncbi:MAG: hypothetical protein GY719_05775 [bacterium]|nr:hypothetical protein [bacterium]
MIELKPISPQAIEAALEKADHYRLLNEPVQAESICLDVLEVEPENQRALITIVLALTDQFADNLNRAFREVRELIPRLADGYYQAYYQGIVCERRARSHLRSGSMGAGYMAYDWFRQAMESYEQAAEAAPAGNEDAILRWNACARVINRNPAVVPEPEGVGVPHLLE